MIESPKYLLLIFWRRNRSYYKSPFPIRSLTLNLSFVAHTFHSLTHNVPAAEGVRVAIFPDGGKSSCISSSDAWAIQTRCLTFDLVTHVNRITDFKPSCKLHEQPSHLSDIYKAPTLLARLNLQPPLSNRIPVRFPMMNRTLCIHHRLSCTLR